MSLHSFGLGHEIFQNVVSQVIRILTLNRAILGKLLSTSEHLVFWFVCFRCLVKLGWSYHSQYRVVTRLKLGYVCKVLNVWEKSLSSLLSRFPAHLACNSEVWMLLVPFLTSSTCTHASLASGHAQRPPLPVALTNALFQHQIYNVLSMFPECFPCVSPVQSPCGSPYCKLLKGRGWVHLCYTRERKRSSMRFVLLIIYIEYYYRWPSHPGHKVCCR